MTIGEDHPYKLIDGRLHRRCYRNKWVEVVGKPLDWRHYEGQEREEKRSPGKLYHYHRISIISHKQDK